MLFFKLLSKNRLIKKRITANMRYTTFEALELISDFEKLAQSEGESIELEVIIDRDSERIWKDAITLGKGEGLEYIVYMERTLDRLYTQVGAAIPTNLHHVIEDLEKEYIEQYQEHQSQLSTEQTEEKEEKKVTKKSFKVDKRTIGIAVASLIILSGVGIGLKVFPFTASVARETETSSIIETAESSSSESQLLPLEQFLAEKRFTEALELYPQEFPFIEREIFYLGTDGIPYLEEFLKVKDYDKGHYDLAYLKKDYQSVIGMAHIADTDERLTQLAVAYAKTGRVEEAEKLNATLQVDAITEMIQEHRLSHIIALIKAGKLDEAYSLKGHVQNERVHKFFEELQKAKDALKTIQETLTKEDLEEDAKKTLEAQRQKIEEHIKLLIQTL